MSDEMLSPLPLNHNNNNHVDTLPQHTYATHKLPSFNEMISSRHSSQSPQHENHIDSDPNSDAPIDFSTHNLKNGQLEIEVTGGVHGTDDESSSHAIDLSTTSESMARRIAEQSAQREAISKDESMANDSMLGHYIAKNPNLTFKGSGDIMNMDIIFENVSIEEDASIGGGGGGGNNSVTAQENKSIQEPATVTRISKSQVEKVDIDGVQYEIITLENDSDKTKHLCDNNNQEMQEEIEESVANMKSIVNASRIPVIADDAIGQNYEYDSDQMVIVTDSDLSMATEIQAVEEMDAGKQQLEATPEDSPTKVTAAETDSNLSQMRTSVKMSIGGTSVADDTARRLPDDDDDVQKESLVQNVENNGNDRKRKRKVVPVLARNKRTKRGNTSNAVNIESKEPDVPPNEFKLEPKEEPIHSQIEIHNEMTSKIETSTVKSAPDGDEDDDDDNYSDQIQEEQTTNDIDGNPTMDESDADNDTNERSFMDSLVVVESQDPNDPNRTIHEVYVVDPETNEMSEKPLELPDHVIQRIRLSMQ